MILAPVYALVGYTGSVWFLIALGALSLAIAWRWTVRTLNAPGAATFAWAAIALSSPFTFNTFTVYPEIAAGLAVIFAFDTTLTTNTERSGPLPWIAAGLAIARCPAEHEVRADVPALLWSSFSVWVRGNRFIFTKLESLGGGGDLCDLARRWFAFFYAIWGKPLHCSVPDRSGDQPLYFGLGAGAAVRSEYGLLAYAPVYIRAARGCSNVRAGGELRRQALEITFIFSALLVIVGSFHIWWGGAAAPARPIAAGLPLLMLPIAVAFRAAPAGSPRRAAQHLLLWVGVGIAITLAIGQNGLLISNSRDGTSALLDFWSPRWDLWSLAPSFVRQQWAIAWLLTTVWLAIAGAAALVLSRTRSSRAGVSALFAFLMFGIACWSRVTAPWLPPGRTEARTIWSRRQARLARSTLRCAGRQHQSLRPPAQGRRVAAFRGWCPA